MSWLYDEAPPRGRFVALYDGMTSLFREENGQLYSIEGIKCISWFRQQEDGKHDPKRARANQRIAWEKNTPSIVQFITNAT